MNFVAGALKSLDELSEERGNLEKAFRWEWDNDEVLKGRTPPGVNPNQMFRDGLKRFVQSSQVWQSIKGNGPRYAINNNNIKSKLCKITIH